jgi:hypothetical protein
MSFARERDTRCGFRLDLAVASRTYSKCSIGVGQLDPERGNVNDCAVDGVLRRHRVKTIPRLFRSWRARVTFFARL